MSGPILAHAAKLGMLGPDKHDQQQKARRREQEKVLPLHERTFDVSIGAEQLAHAKQHIADLNAKIRSLETDLQLTTMAIAKRGNILDYVRETILRDLLQLVKDDAKRIEYQKLLLSILDDDKLLEMHREMVDLLHRDEAARTEKRIKELEAKDLQMQRALSEKDRRILTAEGETLEAKEQERLAKVNVDKMLTQLGKAKEEKADVQHELATMQRQVSQLEEALSATQQEVTIRDVKLAAQADEIANLQDQLEYATQNTDAGAKSVAMAVQGVTTATAELVRLQEQSAAATKGSTFWLQCKASMLEAVEKVRTAATDFTVVEGLREVFNQFLKVIVVEVGTTKNYQVMLNEMNENKKTEAERFHKSLAAVEADVQSIVDKQCKLEKDAATAAAKGQSPPTLHEQAMQLLPSFMGADDKCEIILDPRVQALVQKTLNIAHSVLKNVATSFGGARRGSTLRKDSNASDNSRRGSTVGIPIENASTSQENKQLQTALEELKTLQATSEEEVKRNKGLLDEGWRIGQDSIRGYFSEVKLAAQGPVSVPHFVTLLKVLESATRSSNVLQKAAEDQLNENRGIKARFEKVEQTMEKLEAESQELAALKTEKEEYEKEQQQKHEQEMRDLEEAEAFCEQLKQAATEIHEGVSQACCSWQATSDSYMAHLGSPTTEAILALKDTASTAPSSINSTGMDALERLCDTVLATLEDAASWSELFGLENKKTAKMITDALPTNPALKAMKKLKKTKEKGDATPRTAAQQDGTKPSNEFGVALRLKVANTVRETKGLPSLDTLLTPPSAAPTPSKSSSPDKKKVKTATGFIQCELVGGKFVDIGLEPTSPQQPTPKKSPSIVKKGLKTSGRKSIKSPRSPLGSTLGGGSDTTNTTSVDDGYLSTSQELHLPPAIQHSLTKPETVEADMQTDPVSFTSVAVVGQQLSGSVHSLDVERCSKLIQTDSLSSSITSPLQPGIVPQPSNSDLKSLTKAPSTLRTQRQGSLPHMQGSSEGPLRSSTASKAEVATIDEDAVADDASLANKGVQASVNVANASCGDSPDMDHHARSVNTTPWSEVLHLYISKMLPAIQQSMQLPPVFSSIAGNSASSVIGSNSSNNAVTMTGGSASAVSAQLRGTGSPHRQSISPFNIIEALMPMIEEIDVMGIEAEPTMHPVAHKQELMLPVDNSTLRKTTASGRPASAPQSGLAGSRYSVEALQAVALQQRETHRVSPSTSPTRQPPHASTHAMTFEGDASRDQQVPAHLAHLLKDTTRTGSPLHDHSRGISDRSLQMRSASPESMGLGKYTQRMPLSALDGEPIPEELAKKHRPAISPHRNQTHVVDLSSELPQDPSPVAMQPLVAEPRQSRRSQRGASSKRPQQKPTSPMPVRVGRHRRRADEVNKLHKHIGKHVDKNFGKGAARPVDSLRARVEFPPDVDNLHRPASSTGIRPREHKERVSPVRRPASAVPASRPSIRDLANNVCGEEARISNAITQISAQRGGQSHIQLSRPQSAPMPKKGGTMAARVSAAVQQRQQQRQQQVSSDPHQGTHLQPDEEEVTIDDLQRLGVVHLPVEVAMALNIGN